MKIRIGLFLVFCFFQTALAQNNEKWLEDFEAVKKFMAEGYANLEWARNGKKIDLAALNKKTQDELAKASTDQQAMEILEKFLKSFQDGHLKLRKVDNSPVQTEDKRQSFAPDTSAEKVCSELGYKFRLKRFSLPFENAPNFKLFSTDKDYFPAAIFTLENGKKFGVLNIGLFSPDGYLGNCQASWEEFRPTLNAPCDEKCQGRFDTVIANRLSAKLTGQIKILQSQKIDYLIVDIGGNGGGTNWVEPAVRIISPKPVRSTLAGFIRHPHWVAINQQMLDDVLDDLTRKDLNAKQIGYLKTAKERLEKYIEEAKSPCDMSFVWTSDEQRKKCTILNTTPSLTTGIFERLPVEEISNLKSKNILFKAVGYDFEESVFKGNLIVLVDRKTASAAENFASYIQAGKSGEIVGEKTFGAGCGYVNGGTKYFLPNSKFQLLMPDCVRYRADGANEVEGVVPDINLWEANDDKPQKLEKLIAYLSKVE